MLEVQKYLQNNTLADLEREFAIKATYHPSDPLVILNYTQGESPKLHPITRECRALVLTTEGELVARSFPRFFNWGEVPSEEHLFNWSNFVAEEKHDGSLVLIYHWGGKWRINTRRTFGDGTLPRDKTRTWDTCIRKMIDLSRLDPLVTYVCEFCSPFNKVLRNYSKPTLYLLAGFVQDVEIPVPGIHFPGFRGNPGWEFVRWSNFDSIAGIRENLQKKAETDPTFEGYVIKDGANRWKVKNPEYVRLHAIGTNGEGTPKHLVPYILANETDELLTYFPEHKGRLDEYAEVIDGAYAKLDSVRRSVVGITEQRDFAKEIIVKTPFTNILFCLRRDYGIDLPEGKMREIWRDSEQLILKCLFREAVNACRDH